MTDTVNPLTTKHYNGLNKAHASIIEARRLIDRAKKAGMDVADAENDIDAVEHDIIDIKKTFFPDRS